MKILPLTIGCTNFCGVNCNVFTVCFGVTELGVAICCTFGVVTNGGGTFIEVCVGFGAETTGGGKSYFCI